MKIKSGVSAGELARLVSESLADIGLEAPRTTAADYSDVIGRIRRMVPTLREQVERNRERVEERYRDLTDQPEGRRATLLANSPPSLLVALAHGLMRESFSHRFDDAERSLALASLAHEAASAASESDYLGSESGYDLLAETLDHVGNARRLCSDLIGAERALKEAGRCLELGTRDRYLRAHHLSL